MSGQHFDTLVLKPAFRVSAERPELRKRKGKRSKRPTPVSLRLTVEERAQLEREAGGRSLSAHIRDCLFNGRAAPRKTKSAGSVKDHAALARVLSAPRPVEPSPKILTIWPGRCGTAASSSRWKANRRYNVPAPTSQPCAATCSKRSACASGNER